MTPENFVYWLQGMLEIGNPKTLNEEQVQTIKDHIALVLTKVTPDRSDNPTEAKIPLSPWWGVQLPRSDGYMTCTDQLSMPASCGIPISANYVIESTC